MSSLARSSRQREVVWSSGKLLLERLCDGSVRRFVSPITLVQVGLGSLGLIKWKTIERSGGSLVQHGTCVGKSKETEALDRYRDLFSAQDLKAMDDAPTFVSGASLSERIRFRCGGTVAAGSR